MRLTANLILILCLAAASLAGAGQDRVDYLDLAALMLRDGNPDRAISALDQVDPNADGTDRLRYFTLRGLAHLRRHEPEPAVAALEQAAATGQAEPIVFVYLAQGYFSLDRYADTLAALDRAGPALAHIASLYHLRAQCQWLLGEHALAFATLEQAAQVFPGDSSFLRRKVFFLMHLGLYREAAEQGRIYLERSEGKREDYLALGDAMRASGELDEAARLLERARLLYPGDTELNKLLAHTYIDRGELNAAAGLVHEAALLNPALTIEAAEVYRRAGQLGRALLLNGQVSDQREKFRQRLALLLELKRFESAAAMEQDLRRVGLLADQDIRYALGYALFKSGEFAAAELQLEQLTRPDLFRKAAELRRAMQDCAGDAWQCL